MTYDALGRRVEQATGATYQVILYGPDGGKLALMNGQTVIRVFLPLPGRATAVYASTGLSYYRHSDWLGSARFASTPARTMYKDRAYAPFGEPYAEADTTDRNFTGQNQDLAGDLYDFAYREYHPTQGRWTTPDPAGQAAADLADPQTWNAYGYVRNDPERLVDPDGLEFFWVGNCLWNRQYYYVQGERQGYDDFLVACNLPYDIGHGSDNWFGPGGGRGRAGSTEQVKPPAPETSQQTFRQCMLQRAEFFSIAGMFDLVFHTNVRSDAVVDLVFGNTMLGLAKAGPASGSGLNLAATSAVPKAAGEVLSHGRRTGALMSLNLAGKTGRAPKALSRALGWTNTLEGLKLVGSVMKLDPGFIAGEAITCLVVR
jgi:RHS repeat-associated protein